MLDRVGLLGKIVYMKDRMGQGWCYTILLWEKDT